MCKMISPVSWGPPEQWCNIALSVCLCVFWVFFFCVCSCLSSCVCVHVSFWFRVTPLSKFFTITSTIFLAHLICVIIIKYLFFLIKFCLGLVVHALTWIYHYTKMLYVKCVLLFLIAYLLKICMFNKTTISTQMRKYFIFFYEHNHRKC